jgi:4-aminobutyrate aminotransferase-like enzyme
MARSTPTTAPLLDAAAEAARAGWEDAVVGGRRLNRRTATVSVTGTPEPDDAGDVRARWQRELFPTTLAPDSPVIQLGWPVHGPFVLSERGVYFDAYLAVAMKVLDARHPAFGRMTKDLLDADALLRREIVTDDYLQIPSGLHVKTAADLAALWGQTVQARWADPVGWRTFLSSSGAEAMECALKIAYETAYKRFVSRHGMDVFRRVQQALSFAEVPYFAKDKDLPAHAVWSDYPFRVVACEGAFHGRTLGVLALTRSKKAHQLGYPKAWNVVHVPYNDPGDPVGDLLDRRPIEEILAIPGELSRVVREKGRIPKDLFAAFVAEPFQGEGGYVPGDAAFFQKARAACDAAGALLVLDEVQSVARTGRLFMAEHLGVVPDVVATAKSMVVGVTVARAGLAEHMHVGWHSNTWGGGRVFDVNFAHTTLDALLHHKDPAFGGLSYLENEEAKGERLRQGLDRLAERHPGLVAGHRGLGLMRALVVRRRSDVVRTGWSKGVKLLGCGLPGDVAAIRLLLLADTLAREVDELLRVLDATLTAVSRSS